MIAPYSNLLSFFVCSKSPRNQPRHAEKIIAAVVDAGWEHFNERIVELLKRITLQRTNAATGRTSSLSAEVDALERQIRAERQRILAVRKRDAEAVVPPKHAEAHAELIRDAERLEIEILAPHVEQLEVRCVRVNAPLSRYIGTSMGYRGERFAQGDFILELVLLGGGGG